MKWIFNVYYFLIPSKILFLVKMVKGYDTTLSDPSKILLDYLFSFFDSTRTTITPEQASSYIKQWLRSNTSTSEIYKKFN